MDLMSISNYHDKNSIISQLEDDLLEITQNLALEKEKVRKLEQELDHIKRQKINSAAKARKPRNEKPLTDTQIEICHLIARAKEDNFKGTVVSKCIEIAVVVGVNYKEVRQFWSKKKLLKQVSS